MGRPRLPINHHKEEKVEMNVRVPESLWKKIGRATFVLNCTKAQVIEQAIQEFMDRRGIKLDHKI